MWAEVFNVREVLESHEKGETRKKPEVLSWNLTYQYELLDFIF